MKVGIIGAGPAGLASIRFAVQYNLECLAFERTEDVGGVWVYRDPSSTKEQASFYRNGMYKSLRTNLPTQLMEFMGYEFKPESGLGYPGHEEVLKYINDFTRDFNLLQYIKFGQEVVKVSRQNETWKVVVRNLGEDTTDEYNFDAVMVCTGNNEVPLYPDIPGMHTFTGYQVHAQGYNDNLPFTGKTVLIVGVGPSALDFCYDCSAVAKKVILCYRKNPIECVREPNIVQKGEITSIDRSIVNFLDGTSENIDAIIYCTGYILNFDFLDNSCGVKTEAGRRIINPLYKCFLNINHPTMCFISLLQHGFVFSLCEIQAEVFMRLLTKKIPEPSKAKMLQHLESEQKEKEAKNITVFHYYYLRTDGIRVYLRDLCDMGGIKQLPEVIFAIYDQSAATYNNNYKILRNYAFRVIDDENYKYFEINK